MTIPRRLLGRTGLEVSQLGFGAMELRGERMWGRRPCPPAQARTILAAVLDAGINFIDTANDYGQSELFIGQFAAARRAEYFLATKCGCHMQYAPDQDETPHIWTRDNLLRNIGDSLLKMQTDYVDILQLHNPDAHTCEEAGLVDVLSELKKAGAIRFLGCSTTAPHFQTYLDWGVFDVFQIPYSALERRHENLLTRAGEAGAGLIIRGGVARGEPAAGQGSVDRWQLFEKARLDELREPGESRTAFLLRFTLAHPHCQTVIVGTLQPEHLHENIRAAVRGPLSLEIYAEAKARLDAAGERPEESALM